MNNETKSNPKLHTIKSIKRTKEVQDEINFQGKAITSCSAFIAGYFGLVTLYNVINQGFSSLQAYPAAPIATAITSSILTLSLSAYIKTKIEDKKEIAKIRKETGMTKEKQREILENLVLEGDLEAIELYDYFYGERKRKKIR